MLRGREGSAFGQAENGRETGRRRSPAHIFAISFRACRQVISLSLSFSISVFADCRPLPSAQPKYLCEHALCAQTLVRVGAGKERTHEGEARRLNHVQLMRLQLLRDRGDSQAHRMLSKAFTRTDLVIRCENARRAERAKRSVKREVVHVFAQAVAEHIGRDVIVVQLGEARAFGARAVHQLAPVRDEPGERHPRKLVDGLQPPVRSGHEKFRHQELLDGEHDAV